MYVYKHILMNESHELCCELGGVLSGEERARAAAFLAQQNLRLPDHPVARITVSGTRDVCPHRTRFGDGADFCTSTCYIGEVARTRAERLSR